MAEISLLDFRLFLNRQVCRLYPVERQKLNDLHVSGCYVGDFRFVHGLRSKQTRRYSEDEIVRVNPVHARVRHAAGRPTYAHSCLW